MTRPLIVLVAAALVATTAGAASAELQRLYVLDCGINQGKDQSRWSFTEQGAMVDFTGRTVVAATVPDWVAAA